MPAPIRATTQEHLDIADISDNLILLKTGGACTIIQISAVNFDLLSEQEQDAIIYAYAALLNSLTYPIQIMVRSQNKDISGYLKLLEEQERRVFNSKRRLQINQYRQFVGRIVKEGNVLDKKFYCVIPFSPLEMGVSKSFKPFSQGPQTLPFDKNYIISKASAVLGPKQNHLIGQFARIGLIAKTLNTQELTQLFYNVYNPDSTKGTRLASAQQYQTPIVEPLKNYSPQTQNSSGQD